MSTNIGLLEKSEKELSTNFLSMFHFSLKMHIRLKEYIDTNNITEETLNKFRNYKESIIEQKNHLKDDCIWIISKDEPRANHLRYIIAILYSIKDLERVSEYAYNIFSLIHKYKFSKTYLNEMSILLEESNKTFNKLLSLFEKDNKVKIEDQYEKEVFTFKSSYKEIVRNNISKIDLTVEKNIDDFFNFSIMVKYLERTIDHIGLIFDNFMKIK